MSDSDRDWLEAFWGDLLSEEPPRIVSAWARLEAEEREGVFDHLVRMAREPGWAEVQRTAAQAALHAISRSETPGSQAGDHDKPATG
jgi:hypothetical protein